MQHTNDLKFLTKENVPVNLSLWNQIGPFLLLGAFTLLIFRYAPFFSLLLLTSIVGYAANLFWKKRGFYFSLFSLMAVSIYTIRSGVDPFWSSLFSASIALSWLLIFLGKQEFETLSSGREENIKILKERCETLSQDIFAYQRKEIAFQHGLEDAQSQLLKLKNQLYCNQPVEQNKESKPVSANIIPQEENDPQEKARREHVQRQYTLLREQFDEKSEALDQARKDLFRVENELLALQSIYHEKTLEIPEEDRFLMSDLKRTEEECAELEAQVLALQELISALLSHKKRAVRSRKSLDTQERLPLLIQEKIDQTISSDSTSG